MSGALVALLLAQAFAQPRPPAELDGTIAGRVCEDLDGDGACSEGEPGLARVRLVLETGQEVSTDDEGRYHFAAVDARVPSAANGGRLLWGRHRLRVDRRTLLAGAHLAEESVTIELSMGAVVRHDFAVEVPREVTRPISTAPTAPPAASVKPGGIDFLVSGRAAPGDAVQVGEAQTTAGADGGYSLWVKLQPGKNELAIQVRSGAGEERLYRQRVDVVRQGAELLIVPRAPVLEATVHLPAAQREKAVAGRTALRIQAAPGTRIHGPQGDVVVRQGGVAEIPVELSPGENQVKLAITPPGEATHEQSLTIGAAPVPFVVGLLDLEGAYDVNTHGFRLFGRGAAHGEAKVGAWSFAGELSLNDLDIQAAHAQGAQLLEYARRPETPERALDPDRYPFVFGDDSVGAVPNAAEGRLRLSVKHERFGELAFGSERAQLDAAEVGRYQREIFGPSANLTLDTRPAKLELRAFDGTALADPTRGLATAPVHEELLATGGSLYYLHEGAIAEGSEVVTVELREGLGSAPIAQRHLVRGRDYEIDYAQGRILLAQPISFALLGSALPADALSAGAEEVLVVDASRLSFSGQSPAVTGGELDARVGPVDLRAGGVDQREPSGYRMVHGSVGVPLGPLTFWAEGAVSRNHALLPGDLALSDDGGLAFASAPSNPDSKGEAFTLRLKGPLLEGGTFDASFRRRTPGFSDEAHDELTGMHQLHLRAEQPIASVRVAARADDFRGADPRDPFSGVEVWGHTVGGSVGWQGERLGVSAQVKDATLTAPERVGQPELEGGRTSLGVAASYRLSDRLTLLASDEQVVSKRGEGLGAQDDSFAKAGFALNLPRSEVALEGGWGPHLGPQVLGRAQVKDGDDTYYGSYSVDVDGPDFGTARSVSGVSSKLGDRSSVFVEDVAAHDANTVRLSKAVGFSEDVGGGLSVSARYERGAHSDLDALPSLLRDTAGVSVQWVHGWLKAYARGEIRHDRGIPLLGPPVPVDLTQRVLSGAIEADLREDLRASARFNFGDTYSPTTRLARFLEGGAGLAWTHAPWLVLLRYSITRGLEPPPSAEPERTLQIFSLLPSVDLGPRFTLGAGVNAALSGDVGKPSQWIVSASGRPAVRVWRGLELAVELARRSASLDGGKLTALRGEVGYRFGPMALIAAGYTAFGFSGLGLSPTGSGDEDRLYLRAELGI